MPKLHRKKIICVRKIVRSTADASTTATSALSVEVPIALRAALDRSHPRHRVGASSAVVPAVAVTSAGAGAGGATAATAAVTATATATATCGTSIPAITAATATTAATSYLRSWTSIEKSEGLCDSPLYVYVSILHLPAQNKIAKAEDTCAVR